VQFQLSFLPLYQEAMNRRRPLDSIAEGLSLDLGLVKESVKIGGTIPHCFEIFEIASLIQDFPSKNFHWRFL